MEEELYKQTLTFDKIMSCIIALSLNQKKIILTTN
jgi:hypothetical protein